MRQFPVSVRRLYNDMRRLYWDITRKIAKKKLFLRGDFRPFSNENVQMLDHFFSLLFPKDSESLKILDIRLREVGAKRPLNGTSKVNRQTDGQTDRRTFRLIESIGPGGRCFEKSKPFCSMYCLLDCIKLPPYYSSNWVSHQGYKKFKIVQYNRILNIKLL